MPCPLYKNQQANPKKKDSTILLPWRKFLHSPAEIPALSRQHVHSYVLQEDASHHYNHTALGERDDIRWRICNISILRTSNCSRATVSNLKVRLHKCWPPPPPQKKGEMHREEIDVVAWGATRLVTTNTSYKRYGNSYNWHFQGRIFMVLDQLQWIRCTKCNVISCFTKS